MNAANNEEQGRRVMQWNTGQHLAGEIGDKQIAWLASEAWESAILLEVTRPGLRRLRAEADAWGWTGSARLSDHAPGIADVLL